MVESDQADQSHAAAGATALPADGSSSSSSDKNNNAPSAPAPPVAPSASTDAGGGRGDEEEEDDMLLVTEFPPPPYYYTLASRQTPSHLRLTTPPDIPHRAFRVAAKRVMMERTKAREESERIRLEAEMVIAGDRGSGSGSGASASAGGSTNNASENVGPESSSDKIIMDSTTAIKKEPKVEEADDDSIDPNDPNEPVVAVFGEIVEDPTLVVEEECHDPVIIRDNVKRLNRAVLQGFWMLVQKLVNDPNDNKKLRDELSHNLFLMLQECNKFREHQAREILIETLERQLECRREGLAMLQRQIGEADDALAGLQKFRES